MYTGCQFFIPSPTPWLKQEEELETVEITVPEREYACRNPFEFSIVINHNQVFLQLD